LRIGRTIIVIGVLCTLVSLRAVGQQGAPLGTAQLRVSGARLTIYGDSLTIDADQTLNVGEPARVRTCYGSGAACGSAASGSVPGLKVVGELTGPELPQAVPYETAPGGTFFLPGFQREGDYLLENIRLVDTATGRVLANAEPSLTTLHVRQILLASATVTRLTLADLQARGITLTQTNFQAFSCRSHEPSAPRRPVQKRKAGPLDPAFCSIRVTGTNGCLAQGNVGLPTTACQ